MMRSLITFLVLSCVLAATAPCATAQVEIFGGYSYVYAHTPVTTTTPCPLTPCPTETTTYKTNLNGFELAGTFKPSSWFGITGDYSSHWGTSAGASNHLQTFLVGPKFSFPADISPFVHFLVGGANNSLGSGSTSNVTVVPTSRTSFALAAGAGIDARIAPFVSLRVIQFDYLLTTFRATTQNQPRVSTGIVIHF
jgi:opacity protein-like surface antigen